MFGLKLKSWMEAHLGRHHRQKSTSSSGGPTTGTSIPSLSSSSTTCSSSPAAAAPLSSQSHLQKKAGAPKDICGSFSSTSNSTTSSSNGSTTTAIGVGSGSFAGGNNNPTFCNFQSTSTTTTTSTTNSSVVPSTSAVDAVGFPDSESQQSAQQQQQEVKIGKYCGGGGSSSSSASTSTAQKGDTIDTKDSEHDSHAPGESLLKRDPTTSSIPASNSNSNRASTVSTSVSNSTSIISGGSSFCNSLSSPDTGYSTDGYSPKSVYPALSFPAEHTNTHSHNPSITKHNNNSSASSSSKSSYTISSLVSSELLHSSASESKQTSASCSVQDGLDERATCSPPISLLVSSQSSSSGISETSGGLHAPFPKGLHSTSIPENDSTDSSASKENQVIMGVDGDSRAGGNQPKKTIQLELEQKCGTVSSPAVKTSSKFSPFSIDFFKRTSTTSIGGDGSNDNISSSNEQPSSKPSHGRTHRRAESMDARTPSHEDYKPLVEGDEDNGEGDMSGSNPSSSHFMTTTSSSSFAAAGGKSIRTSFILNNSGQLVEFNAYKNAFSICSPRRERTRIKTNPWITLSNNKKDDESEEICNKSDNNKSTHANSNGGDGEKVKSESGESGKMRPPPLDTVKGQENKSGGGKSKRAGNLVEINKRSDEEMDNFMEDETGIVDHDSDDRSSSTQATSHVLYRISSASDSGKGSLVETETNRNSTESSCLLSEDSTRNSIISQEASGGSGSSCCGRSSSGESISQHNLHPLVNNSEDTVRKSKSDEQDEKEQQKEKSSQKKNGDQGQRTFRNASVATDLLVKSASVSVGVGTTGSNKSATKQHPVMVDKETDILSDWATNTDVETEDDLETDRDDEDEEGCNNNDDNETVTPAPSSPDRALFSQSSSATTDIDFGDSSAATQASSTQVFPPSSLLRQHNNHQHSNGSSTYANMNSNGVRFHNNSSNNNSQSESCGGESYEHHYHLQQQQQQQQNNNINLNVSTPAYPAVIPIVRPVLAAAQQHDTFSFDLVNSHHSHHHTLQPQQQQFPPGKMFYPHFPLEDDLLEDDYPQTKQSSGHKGLARGALGFLRKIFKKGACSSQRHSPESLASSAAGKKGKRGKSDNNLASLGSPLLTISEPLSNPRYSAAVLTTKKQLNGCYFLTPTPNSFRRRSGGTTGGIFGGQSDSNNSGSDSKGSTGTNKQPSKSVKTDIIRLPQGPLSPPQSIIQRATSSSHSTGSSSSCSVLSGSNGIPQQCSTFLPHAAPVIASSYFQGGPPTSNNSNLIATISQQSNPASNNSSSTSSSVHSLMSTSTCSGNRPPSQNMSKTPIPICQNPYANSTSGTATGRHSTNPFIHSSNNNNSTARSPPPPLISENSPYLNGLQKSRRDLPPPQQQQQSMKGIIPPYESSPRLPPNSSAPSQVRMNSPSFNNSYSPIHRLVVTGGSHLRTSNPTSNNLPGQHYPMESPVPIPRYNNGNTDNNSNNFSTQVINRPHHPTTLISQSPLINHRSSPHPQQQQPQYPPPISSSSHQQSHNFFASPSPILRNPRYQYITSSNQNSPVLNGTKRLNASSTIIMPCSSSSNTGPSGPPPPLLTTFTPLPSSSSSSAVAASSTSSQRESLINNNNNGGGGNTNTITISSSSGGSINLNPSSSRQVVSTSLSYNEFENLSRQQNFFHTNKLNGNNSIPSFISPPAPPHLQQQHHQQPQQQLLHQSHHHTNNKTHHLQQNHYYSSPIVKQRQLHQQTLWNNNEGGGGGGRRQYLNLQQQQQHQQQQIKNQNLRFNSFLVRHRQLPQFYHTQWGLQERIYETVDSEDERSNSGVVLEGDCGGGEEDFSYNHHHQSRSGTGRMTPRMKHSFSLREGGFSFGGEGNHVNGGDFLEEEEEERPTKRSKPKTLSASGRPFPRPVVALPMMPAGTFLSETETRLLECDKESDRKYRRLINEAEALLKEISVEKEKRAAVHAAVGGGGGGGGQRDNNSFRLEDCPQSDPLRRKAYDCWALRRLQQELAGCCASPPVLHRSRLNLQSPSTPTLANNPYLNTFQSLGMSMPPMLPQQVPYLNSSSSNNAGHEIDPNQNSFEF